MIKVTIGQNMNRKTVEVDESTTTLRSVLESNGMNPNATFHLDGDVVTADMLDKTFMDLDRFDSQTPYFLTAVTKAHSAAA